MEQIATCRMERNSIHTARLGGRPDRVEARKVATSLLEARPLAGRAPEYRRAEERD